MKQIDKQNIGGREVRTLKSESEIIFQDEEGRMIPLGIAQLTSGKDAWMKELKCSCLDCGERHKITDLNEGGYCEPCVEASIVEMEGA